MNPYFIISTVFLALMALPTQHRNPLKTWDKKSDEIIALLHPSIRYQVSLALINLAANGIFVRAYSGLRTFAEQNALYAIGRTADLSKSPVTNAKAGSSYHNYGLAVDVVELKNGVALWNYPNQSIIQKEFERQGASSGHNWKFKDTPHYEWSFSLDWRQMLAIYDANKRDIEGYIKI